MQFRHGAFDAEADVCRLPPKQCLAYKRAMSDADRKDARDSGEGQRLDKPEGAQLRKGWTTGACATAATKAAFSALLTRTFPTP